MIKREILLTFSLLLPSVVIAGGGALVEPKSQLAFDYDNVTADVAQQELDECVGIAEQASQRTSVEQKGSGVKGAAKGAAAGALVGSISGNSGSDAAKTGAAIGVVGGRLSSRQDAKNADTQQTEAFKVVLRNCMIDKKYVALN
ncbi:glycine zipper family protein [Vibrio campbellii]|uniref:Glycine zipper family protein n=1 Tax=Vibrio campbellii TaxID=680 RepID=A0ACC7RAD7_9VIBR